ncbi:bifunctional DNA-formamidopyrimidine glycosylase/DNA-(apurinic or apyrimidinic site) lyase [Staphylococcus simiae]|uniref:bifunctional DNA-formamidopyrimidine glycosylase/DNA-(apurinic or apyrimidinic site) lyase n=1 Tax=Staphylococcus simiae TaxID=308354 RepID=UPI001A961177|nr:bifunctional DNA-formamidopyrimidine glycosylase/DNA-(apurinic or apyrimidinic site) lyase [Staphylococcus simiae]MBO1198487.1 bifunctional DNA-formamidopyrimidine glycosylase/DNA-(apurinic or apyrimidinic site) lyase [Staphylococcus simiae]MBO1201581.1 bifunctional DNA-formamidopyrimidine glycosylase/DNA-(apurinic or apyrimidinic site) lyase [Staphylococcus simiae]MBO1204329.1 bifunctional DNA-formamidopyrimidine glycosylase/DNA-(apurinic or apyrimidinic site) lyase [Staphylococcus simiae]M
MPELPEVEHVKRGIEPFIIGETIDKVLFSPKVIEGKDSGRATIIKGIELDTFKQLTEGYIINKVTRRSKYIVFNIENDHDQRVLISHLGMAGGFFIVDQLDDILIPNYRKHWHVIFELSNGKKLVFSDIRRFGEIRNVATIEAYPPFLDIAPEPFTDEALMYYLKRINQKSNINKPIKQVILDHKVIAGCGNIYACEALFRAGIRPDKKVSELSHQQQEMVFYYVREVLEEGIKYGGTSFSDYRHADGKTGAMQLHLNVYKQNNCKVCGDHIETQVIATRNSHYCPTCQK